MLNLFAKHGLFDLDVKAKGDLEIDAHHTVEDVGIVLGQAIKQALGERNPSEGMVLLLFPWMKRWCWLPLI